MNLRENFFKLCFHFNKDQTLIDDLWLEIEQKYSEKERHYHNLHHLEAMFYELEPVKNRIINFSNLSFSVFYHDVIYNADSKSNEEKSAKFAAKKLEKLGLNKIDVTKIHEQILATKSHQKSINNDINYLLDADLSILGKDRQTYLDYKKKIRKEYSIYPDLLYIPGRKKVLKYFLALENIFKTDYFIEKYEMRAKENIELELRTL